MGNNSFAPGSRNPNLFEVMNIANPSKTIFIFNYPINSGATRNLMLIPGVAGDDIRSSLLKGTISHKLRAREITIINSDIDLLEFNAAQLAFEQAAGITVGLQITNDQLATIEQDDIQLVGIVNGINTIYTIPDGIWIQNPPYKIIVYKNGVKQVLGDDYFISESGGPGTGYNTITFVVPPASNPAPPDYLTADYYIENTI